MAKKQNQEMQKEIKELENAKKQMREMMDIVTPKHLYETTGYKLRVFNPARYAELSELLNIQISNSDPFIISCEDFNKFRKFVSDPTRHYIGIRGDK